MIRCVHCGRLVPADSRVKNQRYCGARECQRARKAKWQRDKMAADPDYRANQRAAQRKWIEKRPDYWQKYRERNPRYLKRNRLMQRKRDLERRHVDLAKMDASKAPSGLALGEYYLWPRLANMDASPQKVLLIPTG